MYEKKREAFANINSDFSPSPKQGMGESAVHQNKNHFLIQALLFVCRKTNLFFFGDLF